MRSSGNGRRGLGGQVGKSLGTEKEQAVKSGRTEK